MLAKKEDIKSMKSLCRNAKGRTTDWWKTNCDCSLGIASELMEAIEQYEVPHPHGKYFKHVKLQDALSDGTKSSGVSIIVKAHYHRMQGVHPEEVVVKLVKSSEAHILEKEFDRGSVLYSRFPSSFIQMYEILEGSTSAILPCDDTTDDLSDYIGLVMEEGACDLMKYLKDNPDLKWTEITDISQSVCQIFIDTHACNLMILDGKFSNIVRIEKKGRRASYKAIDFDNMAEIGTDITASARCTPRYCSPEVAVILLAVLHCGKKAPVTLASPLTDAFSYGLMMWELCNEGKSLWDALDVDTKDEKSLLTFISKVTDTQIINAISATFPEKTERHRTCRSVLLACLKVTPTKRSTNKAIFQDRSFFGNADRTSVGDGGKTEEVLNEVIKGLSKLNETQEVLLVQARSNQDALLSKLEAGEKATSDGLKEIIARGDTNSKDVKKFISDTTEASLASIEEKLLVMGERVRKKFDSTLEDISVIIQDAKMETVEDIQSFVSSTSKTLSDKVSAILEDKNSKVSKEVSVEIVKQMSRINVVSNVEGDLQGQVAGLTSLVTSIGKAVGSTSEEYKILKGRLEEMTETLSAINVRL